MVAKCRIEQDIGAIQQQAVWYRPCPSIDKCVVYHRDNIYPVYKVKS